MGGKPIPNCNQESPPVWTQEAYRLLCSEYSFCCPNWVPPQQGTPPFWPGRGEGYPTWVPPGRVPPCPDLAQGVPYLGNPPPLAGYPLGRVPPAGYPPGQGTPQQGTPSQVPPGRVPPRLDLAGYPPQVWTDWKHYLPHPSDAGGNNMLFFSNRHTFFEPFTSLADKSFTNTKYTESCAHAFKISKFRPWNPWKNNPHFKNTLS